MTIDEAIKHAEEVAVEHTKYNRYGGFESCDECAKEHRQLANWLKELKQLREQEPCEDAVSRRAVLRTLDNMDSVLDENRTVETYKELLTACYKDLPSVTSAHKQKWIPVSEKLPEEDGDYLLWGKIDEDEDEYTFIGSYDSGCEEFGIWQEQFDRTTLGCLGSDFFEYASVIAWMPLPKAYKAEMESEG